MDEIIATGCWVTLQPGQASALPNVSRIVTNDRKDHLVAEILNDREQAFDVEPIIREPLPGLHHRTRAFIKVQDGCDNHCTFCVTTIPRGESRSRPIADVISDVQYALEGGVKEIVLTGVHLGSWGQDILICIFAILSDRFCGKRMYRVFGFHRSSRGIWMRTSFHCGKMRAYVNIFICHFKADVMRLLNKWRARPRPLLSAT